ncbi:MAG: family 2 glycosyl transferase [Chitinophagaceae bacterium]|nr:MAG: family 2 glycosyl transferase [Chitinophagaceae bacterium]
MIPAFLFISIILTIAYCLLIGVYAYWFLQLKQYQLDASITPQTTFSIIIPARNEEAMIGKCLAGIQEQNYPTHLFEVIVVDDHSTDHTAEIITQLQVQFPGLKLIHLANHINTTINAYKKKAIEIAVAQTTGNWIVTTDADCEVPPNWLLMMDNYIQKKQPVFVAAPVMFTLHKSWLGLFQVLDFISLQGITAAAVAAGYHSMCNGANLAYNKAAFYAVGQFKGIDHIASGDDMLLMYKMKQQYKDQLGFLFSNQAIVKTAPMDSWANFLQQRIRWASKADRYEEKSIFWVLALVYFFNAFLLIGLILGFFVEELGTNIRLLLLAKTIVECFFMIPVARFFEMQKTLLYFPLMQPFHILYTVIAGWLGKFGTYQWKGRTVN